MTSWLHELPQETTQQQLLDLIGRLNADPAVHGILVQLPLPRQIQEEAVIRAVSPLKDVDGFGPESLGLLAAGRPRFLACTPYGVQQLLVRNGVPLAGAHVVVVGRSNIVGRPLSLILSQKGVDATVTLCHSRSRGVALLTRTADIVVAAIGIVVNGVTALLFMSGRKDDLNIRGAFLHMAADAAPMAAISASAPMVATKTGASDMVNMADMASMTTTVRYSSS